jgi:hypothetical protein
LIAQGPFLPYVILFGVSLNQIFFRSSEQAASVRLVNLWHPFIPLILALFYTAAHTKTGNTKLDMKRHS